jgi:hypothetical protein
MAIDKIVIQYEVQVAGFKKELEGIKAQLKSVEKNAVDGGKKTEQAFQNAGKGSNQFAASLKNLAGTMGLVFGAQQILKFAQDSVKAANVQLQAEGKLRQALQGREAMYDRLTKRASELQKVTVIGDEAIIQQQAFLAAQGRSEEEINKTIDAAIQLSTVMDTDLETAVMQLDATLEGNVGKLGKLDAGFKGLTQEQLKNGGAIDLVNQKYKGFAEQAAATGTGRIKQLENAFGDLQEEIGKQLLPTLQEGAITLNNFIQAVDWNEVFGRIAEITRDAAEPIKDLFSAFGDIFDVFTQNISTGEKTAGVFDAISAAVNFTTTPIRLLAKLFKGLTDNVLIPLIKTGQNVIAWFNEVREGGGFVGAVFNGIASAADSVISKLRGIAEFIGIVDTKEEAAEKAKIKAEKAKEKAINERLEAEKLAAIEKKKIDDEEDAAQAERDAKRQEALKKRIELNKTFNDAMRKLSEELTLLLIEDENKRALKQLELQKAADLRELEATEFTAKQKGELRAQINAKYSQLEKDRLQKQLEDEVKIRETFLKEEEAVRREEEENAKEAEQKKFEEYLKYWELKQQNEINSIEDFRQRKLEELRIAEENEIAKVEASEYSAQLIAEIQKKYGLQRIEIEKQTQQQTNMAIADGLAQLESGFGSMLSSFAAISGESAEYVKALSVVQVGIQTAVALANAIAGATAAATATGPGAPFALAGYIASMIGTVVGAFAQVNQLLTAEVPKPGFFEGTPYLQLGGNPSGKDTIPVMAHEGEAIIPTSKNLQYPGLAKSWINGNLDSYIHNQFVRPALIDQQQKAEEDFADRLAASMALQMSSQFDDYRLHRDLKEQTAVLRNGFYHMKETRKKIRGGR